MEQADIQACKLCALSHCLPGFLLSPSSSIDTGSSGPIDVQRVRKLFALPARVAESNFLRREIATRMHERLALVKIQPQQVLDAGCGEGADLALLQEHYPQAQIMGLDASQALLSVAHDGRQAAMSSMSRLLKKWIPSRHASSALSDTELVCGDFAQLPFKSAAVDLIWSNLALHWHPQPDRVFAEWRRVLRVDGLLMFSCFGPDTFKELRAAFATVDQSPHVLPYVDMHDFGDMLVNAGFSTPVIDMEAITVTYDSIDKLLADVRAWGGNPLKTRRRGLLGRQAWRSVVDVLEQGRRADGKLGLTFEVVYGHAFRPVPKTTSSGESIVRFDLPKR